ncbi:MAG: RNA 2',3'-cyclic phosphodiesterase [Pseudomonadota bacterium]
MRAFVAIELCNAARSSLLTLQEDLDQGRVVPEENLHLTLAFLDDQPQSVLEVLHEVLSDIRMPAFEMSFSGVAARGGRTPALIWAEVEKSVRLQRLHDGVRAAAHQAGIELPRRRFRPHVTLARISRTARVDQGRLTAWLARHGTFRAGPFETRSFGLYRSQLGPGGAIYENLAQYPLAKSGLVSSH